MICINASWTDVSNMQNAHQKQDWMDAGRGKRKEEVELEELNLRASRTRGRIGSERSTTPPFLAYLEIRE
jgi:hypothetical protein